MDTFFPSLPGFGDFLCETINVMPGYCRYVREQHSDHVDEQAGRTNKVLFRNWRGWSPWQVGLVLNRFLPQ